MRFPAVAASAPPRQSELFCHSADPGSTKKADVIDLTIESSSSSSDEDEAEFLIPPSKKHCVYISKNEEVHAKG